MTPGIVVVGATAGLLRESRSLVATSKTLCRDLRQAVAEMNCRMSTTQWLLAEFDDIMACTPCARAIGDERPLPGRHAFGRAESLAEVRLSNDNWPARMPETR